MPVYSPGPDIDYVKSKYGLDEVIKLASNENPLGPSPRALKAMAAVAGDMHLYPDGTGYYLRQKLAGRLGIALESLVLGHDGRHARRPPSKAEGPPDDQQKLVSRCEQNRTGVVSKTGHFVVSKTGRASKAGLLSGPPCRACWRW